MLKKILALSISFCLLFAEIAHATTLKQITNDKFKQTANHKQKTNKQIKIVHRAKIMSVELNYNTLSVTLSYVPEYKHYLKGRTFTLVIPNIHSNIKSSINIPVITSNAVRKSYYLYDKITHTITITAVFRKRIGKNKIRVMSEGHILVVKFPTLKNRPISLSSFPKAIKANNSRYSVKKSKTVYISLKNITMIISPQPITKIIYSKDQNIEISKSLNDAFVKILPLQEQKPNGRIRYIYDSMPRDIYIITQAGTYSLNLIPRRIPSLVMILKKPQITNRRATSHSRSFKQPLSPSGISENISYYHSSVYTNKLANIIKYAYFLKTPSGYSVFSLNKIYKFKQISIKGLNAWAGKNFTVLIYQIKANMPVNLSEKEFLWMSPDPLAISIINPALKQGENTRLFIVEGSNGR
ncbi:MAG: hypothetical protein ACYCUW_01055 [bacterium]